MSRIVKVAAAAIAIAVTAAIVGIVAYDRGRAAPPKGSVRYDLSLKSPATVVAGSVRGSTVQAQPFRGRLGVRPNTVVELRPSPSCHYVTWRTISTESDGR